MSEEWDTSERDRQTLKRETDRIRVRERERKTERGYQSRCGKRNKERREFWKNREVALKTERKSVCPVSERSVREKIENERESEREREGRKTFREEEEGSSLAGWR